MTKCSLAQTSQTARILIALECRTWVPAIALSKLSLQYGARVFALRRAEYWIANRVTIVDGVKNGAVRLILSPEEIPQRGPEMIAPRTPDVQAELFDVHGGHRNE